MTKICIVCKREFSRPKGKSDKVWGMQECCGRDCSSIKRRHSNSPKAIKRRKALVPGARSMSFIKP